ncbi:MAG: CubicO group peptidase (beta-lactamase class C family), partial [Cognaticolwellia sp.]
MLIALLLACASTPKSTALEQSPDPAKAVVELLEVGAPEGVVASVAVIRGSEVQLLGEPERLYELGSISKVFNAWLLATLEEEGVLSEQDLLSKHYPVVPKGNGDQIQLVHLASHSSGLSRLPGNMNLRYLIQNFDAPYVDYDAAMLQQAVADEKVRQEPGTSWAYSNFGAALLGQIMATELQQPWADAVEERVLAPHGLTGIGELEPPAGPGAEGEVATWDFDVMAPAGSLDGDLNAMVAVAQIWLEPDAVMRSMLAVRMESEPYSSGLGWIQGDGYWWHNGGTAAYSTFVAVDPAL